MTKIGSWLLPVITVAVLALPVTALAQQQPLSRFHGRILVDGRLPDCVTVSALFDGQPVGANRECGGRFYVDVVQPVGANYTGKVVAFTIDGRPARETAIWTPNSTTELFLTVVSPHPAVALAPLGANLVRIWGFNTATQTWRMYDPAFTVASDLTELKRGQGYWIKIIFATTVTIGTDVFTLAAGWNLIGWLG
jgi:hypothetical protein